jgi:hypothetical protein
MPANKNETKFRNAVRKAGVSLAAKSDGYYPSLHVYQAEGVYLDADLKELHYYDVHYKAAEPVWFYFSNIDLYNSQLLTAAGFGLKFVEVKSGQGKMRKAFYKAPEKEAKK